MPPATNNFYGIDLICFDFIPSCPQDLKALRKPSKRSHEEAMVKPGPHIRARGWGGPHDILLLDWFTIVFGFTMHGPSICGVFPKRFYMFIPMEIDAKNFKTMAVNPAKKVINWIQQQILGIDSPWPMAPCNVCHAFPIGHYAPQKRWFHKTPNWLVYPWPVSSTFAVCSQWNPVCLFPCISCFSKREIEIIGIDYPWPSLSHICHIIPNDLGICHDLQPQWTRKIG